MKTVSSADLAIGLKYDNDTIDYIGKYVSFKDNSGIFLVKDIKITSVTPEHRPDIDLKFNFIVETVPDKKMLEMTVSIYISSDILDTRIPHVIPEITARLKKWVKVVESKAVNILYEEKQVHSYYKK